MAVEVILPRVDMDMGDGRISLWHAVDGQEVAKGQPLFEMETDKAAMEIEAPGSGILRRLPVEGAIPVGSTVAWICAPGETWEAVADVGVPPAPAAVVKVAASDAALVATPGKTAATPLARRLARQHDITLDTVAGSGPRRRIQARDVAAIVAREPEVVSFAPEPAARPAAVAHASEPGPLHRAWLRKGTGRPLVLVHGFASELNGWRPLVASLAPGRPVLAVDLPGHGRSPALTPTLAGFTDAVAETLAAEGVDAADLVAHSLGAAVAVRLAEQAAFDLRSLLLLAPAGLGPDINGAFLDGLARARSEASLAPWLRLLVSDEAVLGEGFVRATARLRDEATVAAQVEIARALFPDGTQAFSIRDGLARLDMPVRVVFGTEDRIIPWRHALDLGAVALHLFRGVGHMPQLEARPALVRIMAERLRD